ncbi:hypothetical protein RA086_00675 [Lactiplantibacillus sp. WILCCON 0030]|uniref:DUF2812 domain-containing protein n=1 Tax=Lactiplantibacillus brownii TaxID=3069269 RepID=A0ABU1A5G3_9LACO|nr:hypothetical protein [Lactiplantibacillus brownii]MDQ7936163.1 hypothetical protein [Lactiplantibacillus brownii]
MWRYRFLIKGSGQELTWLNKLAKSGWLLAGIHGNWYHFKHVKQIYRLFSEYVPTEFVAEITQANQVFQVLATVQVEKPDIQVVYTGSDQPEVVAAQVSPGDPRMRLKVALGMRDKALNMINLLIYLGVGFLGVLIFTMTSGAQLLLAMIYVFFGIYVIFRFFLSAKNLQNQIVILRRETQSYDGAWMPTMHVFLEPLKTDLDTDALKSLGRWHLVGRSHKGMCWYDLQTLASESEIKQVLRPVVPTETTVNVMSWLGLAPLGWII